MSQAYENLVDTFRRVHHLSHFSSLAGWDEAVMMPSGGSDSRAEAMAELHVVIQECLTHPKVSEDLQVAKQSFDQLEAWQQSNLELMYRKWKDLNAIDSELLKNKTMAEMKTEQLWRDLRGKNNWKDFVPQFKNLFSLVRQAAEQRGAAFGLEPYDALLDQFEQGLTQVRVEQLFNPLKSFLPDFLNQVREKQLMSPAQPIHASIPAEKQKEVSQVIMKNLGFDFNHGRLDVSHHPFCGGVSDDVRITTRYIEDDFLSALLATIHETGHASYEQGLPKDWKGQPIGEAMGMVVHESQSLFFEMQLARTNSFAKFLSRLVNESWSEYSQNNDFSERNLLKHIQKVEPGYIRVDADEVTYPLHIILRFEIEKLLFSDEIQISDIPDIWNEKMQQYLGLSTQGNDKDGCMQDVHWPAGLFGYFPCYTLGAIMASQWMDGMKKSIKEEEIDSMIEKGELSPVRDWLEKNAWSQGSSLTFDQLIQEASGQELSVDNYISHLKRRYL